MAKRSTVLAASVAAAAVVVGGAATVLSRAGDDGGGRTVVTVNLWDEGVAPAYERSFEVFEARTEDIDVQVEVTPWDSYWDDLLVDVGGGTAADVFWLNSAFTRYADNGNLVDVSTVFDDDAVAGWDPAVVEQYTRDGVLWGVPQLSDGGKAVLYNKDLLAAAGLSEDDLVGLTWDPAGTDDTLLPVLQKLTLDGAGRTANDPAFDPATVAQFGYNAGYDLDAIVLNYIGSNGGGWRSEQEFTFAETAAADAIRYVIDLVTTAHVAPSAADTNENGSFSKEQFLAGRLALFQTGLYNLAEVSDTATFDWGVAPVPAGPAGARTVTNGIVAAGNAHSEHPEETARVLRWLGSAEGSEAIGASGSAVPAVIAAQEAYHTVWAEKGIDVAPFFDVGTFTLPNLDSTRTTEAQAELEPILKEVFLGRIDVGDGVRRAQDAANAALQE